VARSGERMRLESAHSRPDGSVVQLDTIVSPVIVDTTVVGSVVSARDVTGERRLKQEKHDLAEQLRQAQKMDAIGRLAGGIAHDFNNLLTIICSYSSFVDEGLAERDPLKADVREIIDASNRATTLIRQLLAFSRKQVLEPRVLDLNAVVLGLEKMLARLIGEHIELRIRLAPELGRVSADPSQLEQILMNLAINARDAMPNGGRLSVATVEREVVPKGEGSVPGIVPGAYVVLTVRDTGVGMSPEVRERVFEPFYTTKDPGQGTGLGLATVYGIVKQSGGEIRVDSTAGLGTVFDIYLPRADEEPPEEQAAAAPSELRGSETLLLVEDERSVRELATRVLTEAGYHVIPASNGIEALAAVERHRGAIHLVVSDVVMPQMGGKELSDRLSSRAHATRVLFMSGYTDDAIARHGVLEEGTHLLSKPFTGATLLRKVRQVLDQD